MIKLVETVTFPNGETKETTKEFTSRWSLEREFRRNLLPWAVLKELRREDRCILKMPWVYEGKQLEVDILIKIEDIEKS